MAAGDAAAVPAPGSLPDSPWLSYNGTADGQRYAHVGQITPDNAGLDFDPAMWTGDWKFITGAERMNSGSPCVLTKRLRTSITRLERIEPATSMSGVRACIRRGCPTC